MRYIPFYLQVLLNIWGNATGYIFILKADATDHWNKYEFQVYPFD